MRTPGSLGDLLPVAVPGFIVVGALSILVLPTVVGALAFGGSTGQLVVGVVTGTLVLGYFVAGLQEMLAARWGSWALPPASHFAGDEAVVRVPATAVERAGFVPIDIHDVEVPLATAYALERSLSGEWGTPEGAGWDRAAFLQRVTLALWLSAALAAVFLVGAALAGSLDRAMRSHAGAVLVLGALTAWLVGRVVRRVRLEAVVDLLADARALLADRGDVAEVRRVLGDLGLELAGESLSASVSR